MSKASENLPALADAEEQLQAELLKGLNSTESKLTPADWQDIRREARARVEARKQGR